MALDKQIQLYNFDTSCFYDDNEKILSIKLNKVKRVQNIFKKKIDDIQKLYKKNKIDKEVFDAEYGYLFNIYNRAKNLKNLYEKRLLESFDDCNKNITIRELREESIKSENIISSFSSSLTRVLGLQTNQLTDEIVVIKTYYYQVAESLIKNGFKWDDRKYVLFSASAGQIRTKKFVMIKEAVLNNAQNALTCGLNWDIINSKGGINSNKYLAYYALSNSATEPWETFNIDQSIVVDDFETMVNGDTDYIDDITYEITRKNMDTLIPHTDGCGIMIQDKTRMVRLPWVKGLMVKMDFKTWCEEYGASGDIIDIYGNQWNIFRDDIKFIFTKSQFKMWKFYNDWGEYKALYKKYKCDAGYCNLEEDYIKSNKLNYQLIQTLTVCKDDEIYKIAKNNINIINDLDNNFRNMMDLILNSNSSNVKYFLKESLKLYPELLRDRSVKDFIRDIRNKLIKDTKSGKLFINSRRTFVSPDTFAFCEKLFLNIENPNGLLDNGEIYCNLFEDNTKIDCLRNPHSYIEHCLRINKTNDLCKKWFDTKCVYTSCKDLISRVLTFDCDGDTLLLVADKLFTKMVKRNIKNVVPLTYDMKKAQSVELNYDSLYNGLSLAFSGSNIGIDSNNLTKIWNSENVGEEQDRVAKWLTMETNFRIDSAKTLYMPKRPKEVNKIIQKYTKHKVPYFFKWAKDYEEIIEKSEEENEEKRGVEKINNSTMNKLVKIVDENINKGLRFPKSIGKIDYRILLNNPEFIWQDSYMSIYNRFNELIKEYTIKIRKYDKDDKHTFINLCFKEIFDTMELSNEELDCLIYYGYCLKPNSNKNILWDIYGENIYNNIKINTQSLGKICPICGKRFDIEYNQQVCCSKKCQDILDLEKYKKYNEKR